MSFSVESSLLRVGQQSDEDRLRKLANESGLLMLEQTFTEQLQAAFEEEAENGDEDEGYYRELIPLLVTEALKDSPKLGIGDEIYKELAQKLKLRNA